MAKREKIRGLTFPFMAFFPSHWAYILCVSFFLLVGFHCVYGLCGLCSINNCLIDIGVEISFVIHNCYIIEHQNFNTTKPIY